jgi:hypothetical protein
MAGERRALLVATDAYTDPGLTKLRAPAGGVRALADVLADDSIGGFDVRQLINPATDEVKQDIEGFFDDAHLDDLLLLYISGHGLLSQARRLYFATASTKLKRLRATAIEDRFVYDVIEHSRARSIVLVLDCCHSGAFAKGLAPKSALGVDVEQHFNFEGRGHITLMASTGLEYAFEEAETDASVSKLGVLPAGSLFTRSLVEGLRTGDADVDKDGYVSIDELYDYVFARVRERSSHQTPSKSGAGHGHIIIAKNKRTALQHEAEAIERALSHPWPAIRQAAVHELMTMPSGDDPALAEAIEGALRRALQDHNPHVRAAAQVAVLREAGTPLEPERPPPSQSATADVPETVDEHGPSAFSLRISRSQLDDIFAHARREAPNVCCGAVFGRDGKVTAVHPLENVAASPFRFEVEGASLLDLMDKVDDEDALVALYCSRTRASQVRRTRRRPTCGSPQDGLVCSG